MQAKLLSRGLLFMVKSVCVTNGRSKFLLDRLGRCLKLFVSNDSTSCHELASQIGLELFYTRKTQKTIGNTESHMYATVYLNEAATGHSTPAKRGVNFVMVGRTDPSNSDNQNGDGGGLVCVRECVCVCARACMQVCMRVCMMCLQIAIYDNMLPRMIMLIIKIICYIS